MTNVRLAPALFLALAVSAGCASVVVDRVDRFMIYGTIVSEAGEPIHAARCHFVDTALDDWRRGDFESDAIASSDASGQFRTVYEYRWGYRASGTRPGPQHPSGRRSFLIRVKRPGFQPYDAEVDYRALDRTDSGTLEVALGFIVLSPSSRDTD